MRGLLERDNADVDRDVAQCAAVLRIRLVKMKEGNSVTETCTNFSTGQGMGPSSAASGCVPQAEDVLFGNVLCVHSSSR